MLYDLKQIIEKMAKVAPDQLENDLAFKTYSNLLRMWSET